MTKAFSSFYRFNRSNSSIIFSTYCKKNLFLKKIGTVKRIHINVASGKCDVVCIRHHPWKRGSLTCVHEEQNALGACAEDPNWARLASRDTNTNTKLCCPWFPVFTVSIIFATLTEYAPYESFARISRSKTSLMFSNVCTYVCTDLQ